MTSCESKKSYKHGIRFKIQYHMINLDNVWIAKPSSIKRSVWSGLTLCTIFGAYSSVSKVMTDGIDVASPKKLATIIS